MSQKGTQKSRQPGFNSAVLAAVALSLFVLFSPRDGKQAARRVVRSSTASTSNVDKGSVEPLSSILLDSIVSLVQSYYVDSERVTGGQLIAGTMRSLAYAIPALKFEESESFISLSNQSERIEFNSDEEMNYDELLGRLKSLIAFCERVRVIDLMNKGDNIMLGSERDEASIVINALLSSLDAHSSLMSKDAYQELRQDTEGAFGGLGVLVGVRDNILTVLKPLPRSPAVKLGIQKHDKIVSINGHMTFGLTLDKLVGHMRGEPGTVARLVTLRPGSWAPRIVDLKREIIEVDSVEAHEHHQGNLHVLRLEVENFASRTSREIIDNIRRFRKKWPVSGIVLDLRGNPGGLLDQAVLVSDIFLDQGVVVSTRGRREEVEKASRNFEEMNYPLVVLMDEDSASASEIVAGALQDNGRAVVVGQPSFGKGSVQTVFELPEQRALKLTIARYFTPSQKSIQNVGIMPDIWIQPVIRTDQNDNLFGPYRYRNEQFLPNHLSAVASAIPSSRPVVKGYFLRQDGQKDPDHKVDPEMDIAMTIFAKLKGAYGAGLPESARRSGHAIALAMPEIKAQLNRMSIDSAGWLKEKIHVDWGMNSFRDLDKPSLALQIKAPAAGLTGASGSSLDVPWKVTNIGSKNAENVSVFIQSPIAGLETREVLVGRVAAGQSREGKLKIFIPASLSVGRHYVNAGIAVDAQALSNAQGEFLIDVQQGVVSTLAAQVSFVDGDISAEPGVLENREKASLRVVVSNPSNCDAEDVKIVVSNLGGQQIVIPKSEFKVEKIPSKGSKEIIVQIAGQERIESPSIALGVTVSAVSGFEMLSAVTEVATAFRPNNNEKEKRLSH